MLKSSNFLCEITPILVKSDLTPPGKKASHLIWTDDTTPKIIFCPNLWRQMNKYTKSLNNNMLDYFISSSHS